MDIIMNMKEEGILTGINTVRSHALLYIKDPG
jgi:hypothetical protein